MENTGREDTFSYKGWLISDSFVKRSLAVLGYQIVGSLIVYLVLFGIGIAFAGAFMLFR